MWGYWTQLMAIIFLYLFLHGINIADISRSLKNANLGDPIIHKSQLLSFKLNNNFIQLAIIMWEAS